MQFESIVLHAKTLAALCKISVELAEDASNVDQVVSSALSASLATELDRCGMFGSGASGEPCGILNHTGVQVVASVGTPADYSKFSEAVKLVYEKNGAPKTLVMSPRTWATLDALVTTTDGQPLKPLPSYEALEKLVSIQIPNVLGGGAESVCFLGDFSQVLVGVITQLALEVSRVASDSASSAFSNMQIWIRCYLRGDIHLQHPDHLVAMTGVTAT